MKWVYGKQDWKTFERGQENCFLMTNGLGGFSSLTMIGSAARNDHAFFMGCTHAPNNRVNMIHRLSEVLQAGERMYPLSSQEFADGSREEGFRNLAEFSYEDTPVWRFLADGVEIEKEAAMRQGENTVAVVYRIRNRSGRDVRLSVTPFCQFVPKGNDLEEDQTFEWGNGVIRSGELAMCYMTDGEAEIIPESIETCYYSYDECDGRVSSGSAKAGVRFSRAVPAGMSGKLSLVFSMPADYDGGLNASVQTEDSRSESSGGIHLPEGGEDIAEMAESLIRDQKAYRRNLEEQAEYSSDMAGFLARSASQFIAKRESTDGDTILAGFPFFEDWGRDTMIALPGVCIATRRYDEARSILRTFARYERDGLMPNLFPEGGKEPMYNTADAALLFINCVWLYYQATKDRELVREMYPVMEKIVTSYRDGTGYGIHMDDDGLIMAGEELDQVTWMDVRVGEILPTPRHGKPVEINAYWYNALRIMAVFSTFIGEDSAEYEKLAQKVKESFAGAFWMDEKHCLKDVVSGTPADTQIRCNQIWAVSMPFTMLEPERERQIVDTVFEKLYTPYGLRTLEKDDPQFQPFYGGEVLKRDLAYHQGTVWVFPLGAYYLAFLKVNGYSPEAEEYVKVQLEVMESAMREGCIGQLPEIYDGENPVSSKGCFAQAWSVGEMLRVYEILEKGTQQNIQ